MGGKIYLSKELTDSVRVKQTKNERTEIDGGYISTVFDYSCGCHSNYLQTKDGKVIFDHIHYCDFHKPSFNRR